MSMLTRPDALEILTDLLDAQEYKSDGVPVLAFVKRMMDLGVTQERAIADLEELIAQQRISIGSAYKLTSE